VEFCGSIEDAKRRDFTINAIFLDPVTNRIIDHVGGVADLHAGVIRAVGNPDERFREDFLRMLRAIRFAARLNFSIEEATMAAIVRNAPNAASIAAERSRIELSRMFTSAFPHQALQLLLDSGLLKVLLPEVHACIGVEQPVQWHPEGDVFQHTKKAMSHLASGDEIDAWSVLLHDIGKPSTWVKVNGRDSFPGHAEVSQKLAWDLMFRLRFPVDVMEAVSDAISHHTKMHDSGKMNRSTLRRIVGNPHFRHILELNRIDEISSAGLMDGYVAMVDFVVGLNGQPAMPAPFINGRDLISLGLRPGKELGKMLAHIYNAQLEGKIADREQAFEEAERKVKELPHAE
jgi:poly(A) polymerase